MPFKKGASGNPGGRTKSSVTQAIRELADPTKIARFLLDTVVNSEVSMRERLQAAGMIVDRLEGKAVARSISISGSEAMAALPLGFDSMPHDEKLSILRDLRARAIGGALPPGDDHGED